MITSLTPRSLHCKPMPIIIQSALLIFKSCCLEGMISLLPICISTVTGLSSWAVGWMKWCKSLIFVPWKAWKYTLSFIFSWQCFLFSLPTWLFPIIPIFQRFLAVSTKMLSCSVEFLLFLMQSPPVPIYFSVKGNSGLRCCCFPFFSYQYVVIRILITIDHHFLLHSGLLLFLLKEEFSCWFEAAGWIAVILSL